jgi:integrase/recombinase XerD
LESVHARLRPNSTLAVVYDLKVFFTVIDVDPLDVRRRHVLEFIRVQRTGSADATVVPIDQSEGLALSTIRRRLSSLAGFYSHLVALGELDHNPVQRGMPVRSPVTRDRRVIPLVRPVRHLPRILDHDDVIKLVAALRTDRDRAMIDAMLLAGLRRCEVLGLRLSDVRWGERRLFIADGKGGHQRIVPISPRFFDTLRRYLDNERPADAETPFVFVVLKDRTVVGRSRRRDSTRSCSAPAGARGSSMRRVTSCATPVSPGSARPAWPSKHSRLKPVTARSHRRRSTCISPTIGSPASTYVQLKP